MISIIMVSVIITKMLGWYDPSQLHTARNKIAYLLAIIIFIAIHIIYYQHYTQPETSHISVMKIGAIVLSHIAVGIGIIHLFYPYTWTIIIAAIARSTINNAAIWYISHSRYRNRLHPDEYYYWMLANVLIMIINTLLIITRFAVSDTITMLIVIIGYRGLQSLLLYRTYIKYATQHEEFTRYITPSGG
jgi:hypothetical protein